MGTWQQQGYQVVLKYLLVSVTKTWDAITQSVKLYTAPPLELHTALNKDDTSPLKYMPFQDSGSRVEPLQLPMWALRSPESMLETVRPSLVDPTPYRNNTPLFTGFLDERLGSC